MFQWERTVSRVAYGYGCL